MPIISVRRLGLVISPCERMQIASITRPSKPMRFATNPSRRISQGSRPSSWRLLVIFQFPLWWGGPPAILKGWLDRVLAYGFAYVDGYRFDTGLFRGRHAVLSVTTGGTPARFNEEGVYGPIEQLLRPIRRGALEYMGFEVAPSFVCYGAPRMSDEDRQTHLSLWAKQVLELAKLPTDRSLYPADPLSLVEDGAWAKSR